MKTWTLTTRGEIELLVKEGESQNDYYPKGNWKFTTVDFKRIETLVKANLVHDIGIDWLQSLLTWSWVYYYKFRA